MAHARFHFQAPECSLIYSYYNSISTFQYLSQIPHGILCRVQALYNLSECSYQSSAFIGYQPLFIQGKSTELACFYYSDTLVHIDSRQRDSATAFSFCRPLRCCRRSSEEAECSVQEQLNHWQVKQGESTVMAMRL